MGFDDFPKIHIASNFFWLLQIACLVMAGLLSACLKSGQPIIAEKASAKGAKGHLNAMKIRWPSKVLRGQVTDGKTQFFPPADRH